MGKKDLVMDSLESLVGGFKPQVVSPAPEGAADPKGEAAGRQPAGAGAGNGEAAPRRRGRPAGPRREESVRRAVSCKMLEDQYRRIGVICWDAHVSRQDVMDEAYRLFIEAYEKKVGRVIRPEDFDVIEGNPRRSVL